ncbi:MAG: DUF4258 domain-containing protein [Terriglobia bacterium]
MKYQIHLTEHARTRMQQRSVSVHDLNLVLRHGLKIEQNRVRFYFLGRRHLPSSVLPAEREHLEGIVAVVTRDGQVVTVFRRKNLPRKVRSRCQRRNFSIAVPTLRPDPCVSADREFV